MNTEWLTVSEAASYLKLGRSTVYRMVQEGRLPAQKVGRSWRFDKQDLDDYLKSGKLSRNGSKEG